MSSRTRPERVGTVIIGAGQAGLSAGYHLAKRGLPFVIVDADERIGDHWRNHWDVAPPLQPGHVRRSAGHALPGRGVPLPDAATRWVTTWRPTPAGSTCRSSATPGSSACARPTTAASRSTAAARRFEAEPGGRRDRRLPAAARPRRSPRGWTRRSASSIRASTATRPSCATGRSWSSGSATRVRTSRSRRRASHRTYVSGKAFGEFPFRFIDTWRARIGWPVMRFFATHVLTLRTPIGRRMAPQVRTAAAPLLRVRRVDLRRSRRRAVRREDDRRAPTASRCSRTVACSMSPT